MPRQRRPNHAATRPTQNGDTIRRLILTTLTTISIAAGAMLAPASSSAAVDPTCATHYLAVASWSVSSDSATTLWDLKCGGATNSPWNVRLSFQFRDNSGFWHTYDCGANLCYVDRPTTRNNYDGGEEASGQLTWNVAGQIDCDYVRFHALVIFPATYSGQGSSSRNFNSNTYHIGSC